jgi:hypothetical protein
MNKNKYLAYLLLTALVGVVGFAFSQRPVPTLLTTTPAASTTESASQGAVPLSEQITAPPQAPASSAPPSQTERPAVDPKSVSISVEGARYVGVVAEGSTVLEAMNALKAEGLMFEGRAYPSLGFFVETINSNPGKEFLQPLYLPGIRSSGSTSEVIRNS